MKKILLILSFLLTLQIQGQVVKNISEIVGREMTVTEIDLTNQGLTTFPELILNCKNLKVLNISNNGLTDLPAELGSLETLVELNVSGNQGLIAQDIDLVLKEANFMLEALNLSDCDLVRAPEHISKQHELKALDLSENNLLSLPFEYRNLVLLEDVDLSGNYFYDLSWLIKYWWRIQSINLLSNPGYNSGMLLLELSYFEHVESVYVENLKSFPVDRAVVIDKLMLSGSFVSNFRLDEQKILINRLHFDRCQFDEDNYAKDAAINKDFDYICFESIDKAYLQNMTFLKADTLDFKNCELEKEMFNQMNKSIKFIDLRSVKFTKDERKYIADRNPHIEFLFKESIEDNAVQAPPFKNYVDAPEVKTVHSDKATIVQFEKLNVKVPKGAFQTKNGEPYTGPVVLSVKHYSTPEDILFSGIPMTINEGDENFMFSSGGMIDINGQTPAGEQLTLSQNLEVSIESGNADRNMNLYELNENREWVEIGKDQVLEPFKLDQRLVDSVANQDFSKMVRMNVLEVNSRVVPFVKRSNLTPKSSFGIGFHFLPTAKRAIDDKVKDYIYVPYTLSIVKFLGDSKLEFYGDSAKFYKKELKSITKDCLATYKKMRVQGKRRYSLSGPYYIQNVKLIPDLKKDIFKLSFSYKERVMEYPMILVSRTSGIRGELRKNKRFYESYKRVFKKQEKAKRKAYLRVSKAIKQQAILLKKMAVNREKVRQKLLYDNRALMNGKPSSSSIVRAFTISSFGIFNCDVRGRMEKPQPVDDVYDGPEPSKVVVVDYDKNGVVSFENIKKAFFDGNAKSAIILFFGSTMVGIYQNWKGSLNQNPEVRMHDVSKMSNSELYHLIGG